MTLGERAGTITIAGRTVPRLGFGTMRLTGPGITGEPEDRDECLRVVRAAYDGGVRLFDTSWYYGPDTSSRIVREALAPYPEDVLFVSKLGGARRDNGDWYAANHADQLREGAERELSLLGLPQLPVVHLRWMPADGGATFEEMLASFLGLHQDGLIGAIGLSNVSVDQLDRTLDAGIDVATVSNAYGPGSREHDRLLDRCTAAGIAFLPYFSLLTSAGSEALARVAAEVGATPSQVAIAWQLRRSPVVVPIPGTSRTSHLAENLAAAEVELTDAQFAAVTA